MPPSYLRRPLFWALVFYMSALSLLHCGGFFNVWVPSWQLEWRDDEALRLAALVVSPRREDLRGIKFVLDDAQVEGQSVGVRVLAYLPRGAPGLEEVLPGRRVVLTGRLRLPRRPRNPGEFDERGFLDDRGIGWIMQARSVEVLPPPPPVRWRLAYCAEKTRLSMQTAFERGLDATEAGLMTGLTMGYKGPLPRDLNRAVQDAGAMHLLVPSGAKVAFVLLIIAWLCGRLGLPPEARLAAAGLCGGFYTVMVGGEPPYARAYLGALALGLGMLADRESGAFQAAVLSAWAILIAEPRALFSAGFQMTYAAMAGLLLAMPRVDRALPESWPRTARALLCVAAVTAIVEMMLWPIFANTFGRAALLGACANLVLVPLSGIILSAGFAYWALSLCGPARVLAMALRPLTWLLFLFKSICLRAASLPLAAVELSPMSATEILAYYLCAAAILILPRKRIAAVLVAAALAVYAIGAAATRFETEPLRIVYLCLPDRTAAIAWVRGRTWLIGPAGTTAPVRRALKALRVGRVDRTVVLDQTPKFSLCEGGICFRFDPPRVLRQGKEFDIIASRLKKSALEASTDGSRIEIKEAAGAFH